MNSRFIILGIVCLLISGVQSMYGQQYDGTSGLIHVPTADISDELTVRVGGHYLNVGMVPSGFQYNGKPYETYSYYIGFTPLSWLEVSYTEVLFKTKKTYSDQVGYYQKDRHFSFKISPFTEGVYMPLIAIGVQDPFNQEWTGERGSQHYTNYYLAVTKHCDLTIGRIGGHITYRRYNSNTHNDHWNGFVGGVDFRPSCCPMWRLICGYNGDDILVGSDLLLWRLLMLQVSMLDGRFSGGVGLSIQL